MVIIILCVLDPIWRKVVLKRLYCIVDVLEKLNILQKPPLFLAPAQMSDVALQFQSL
eukprot:TRINITY_DN5148_c0_g1_i1.p2 TRINITY_DN5148_c0_g1~~TRINITY_DN5148_c0_g1_i1.p2  ORF type:complete len:57 (-),score=6.33 TRINITY_DN5148_c0_g1_i1:164-334(-)